MRWTIRGVATLALDRRGVVALDELHIAEASRVVTRFFGSSWTGLSRNKARMMARWGICGRVICWRNACEISLLKTTGGRQVHVLGFGTEKLTTNESMPQYNRQVTGLATRVF